MLGSPDQGPGATWRTSTCATGRSSNSGRARAACSSRSSSMARSGRGATFNGTPDDLPGEVLAKLSAGAWLDLDHLSPVERAWKQRRPPPRPRCGVETPEWPGLGTTTDGLAGAAGEYCSWSKLSGLGGVGLTQTERQEFAWHPSEHAGWPTAAAEQEWSVSEMPRHLRAAGSTGGRTREGRNDRLVGGGAARNDDDLIPRSRARWRCEEGLGPLRPPRALTTGVRPWRSGAPAPNQGPHRCRPRSRDLWGDGSCG
jgi:hypothetical protein